MKSHWMKLSGFSFKSPALCHARFFLLTDFQKTEFVDCRSYSALPTVFLRIITRCAIFLWLLAYEHCKTIQPEIITCCLFIYINDGVT